MKNSSKFLTKIKSEANNLRNKRDTLIAEVNASSSDMESFNTQLKMIQNHIIELQEEYVKLESKLNATRSIYEAAKEELSQLQNELRRCSKEIEALEETKEKSLNSSKNTNLEIHKLTENMKKWDKDVLKASKDSDNYLKSNPWIKNERAFFNVDGREYDFKNSDLKECRSKLDNLKSRHDNNSKNINYKVMGMIDKAEIEYDDLSRKRKVILNDKAKIETVIDELEVKKSQALQSTWIKVNRDFGSIFSTLLPGTLAKLEPIEGL
jgi:structural maintenance of chromosome 2